MLVRAKSRKDRLVAFHLGNYAPYGDLPRPTCIPLQYHPSSGTRGKLTRLGGVMYQAVCRMETSCPWSNIAGFRPRKIREFQSGDFDCFVGEFVDENRTRERRPFRVFVRRGANIDPLARQMWPLIRGKQKLMDIFLD